MIDGPTRPVPRFPGSAEDRVAGAIRGELAGFAPVAGVTALASGGDILFAEAILDAGAELHVLLPVAVEAFIAESVAPAGQRWVERFHQLYRRATTTRIVGDAYYQGSGTPFQLVALLIDGLTQLLAIEKHAGALTLAVWDGKPGDGMGGAASFVGHAVQQARSVRCIHPATGAVSVPGQEAVAAAQKHTWSKAEMFDSQIEHRLCSFMFADAKGFSGLKETEIPAFVRWFIRHVERVIRESGVKPLVLNTWGDGLLVVTDSPAELAEIAVRLTQTVHPVSEGLVSPPKFRAGLHCGPAFYLPVDPLTSQPNVYGYDVSRAARIEPITSAGEAWVTESFAIMAAATNAANFTFTDLGLRKLHKDSGDARLFRLGRRGT
jgi:class 3 adenylate cyclase